MTNKPKALPCVECPEPVDGLSFVYILKCRNETLYIGYTRDVRRRLQRHREGTGARHTSLLKSFNLVYVEGPMAPLLAVQREQQLKKWSRAKKTALIMGDMEELRILAKSREP